MKSFAQENIEDGVLCMMKIQYQCQEMKQALEQIFQSLDKHASLQQKLKENLEDICKIHDRQSYSTIDNFVNVKNDESWIVKKEEFAQDLVTNCEDEVDDFIDSSDDIEHCNYDELEDVRKRIAGNTEGNDFSIMNINSVSIGCKYR